MTGRSRIGARGLALAGAIAPYVRGFVGDAVHSELGAVAPEKIYIAKKGR